MTWRPVGYITRKKSVGRKRRSLKSRLAKGRRPRQVPLRRRPRGEPRRARPRQQVRRRRQPEREPAPRYVEQEPVEYVDEQEVEQADRPVEPPKPQYIQDDAMKAAIAREAGLDITKQAAMEPIAPGPQVVSPGPPVQPTDTPLQIPEIPSAPAISEQGGSTELAGTAGKGKLQQ